ncbi:hypothetical protein BDN72DRAFT_851870, partial [Pluteus cervinus]
MAWKNWSNFEWKELRKSSFPSLWSGFDHFWMKHKPPQIFGLTGPEKMPLPTPGSVLARSILWMRNEFRHDSTMITPMYECLTSMDWHTTDVLSDLFLKELDEAMNLVGKDPDMKILSMNDSAPFIREVAGMLQIKDSHPHDTARAECVIKLSHKDSGFLGLFLFGTVFTRDEQKELSEQLLMCALSEVKGLTDQVDSQPGLPEDLTTLVTLLWSVGVCHTDLDLTNQREGSATLYLLQTLLFQLKEYACKESPTDMWARALSVWRAFDSSPDELVWPEEAQPYLADLLWTTMKRGGIKREEISFDKDTE